MVALANIEEFIASSPVAMVGVSRNPVKFGFTAFRELTGKGMKVIPVNPYASQIHGIKVFSNIAALPDEVKAVIIMTPKNKTADIVREARTKGIKQIWIQQKSETKEAINELKGTGINLITNQCILMHYKPHGIHRFHGRLKKLFGRFPK